jgi:hypothetical protein
MLPLFDSVPLYPKDVVFWIQYENEAPSGAIRSPGRGLSLFTGSIRESASVAPGGLTLRGPLPTFGGLAGVRVSHEPAINPHSRTPYA